MVVRGREDLGALFCRLLVERLQSTNTLACGMLRTEEGSSVVMQGLRLPFTLRLEAVLNSGAVI